MRVLAQNDKDILSNFNSSEIECEKENEFLYKFIGQMRQGDQIIPLDESQMLLRGSSLRNTEWVYGIAIYTGHDSKVMMNSTKSKPKHSKIEIAINKYIAMGIIIQIIVCLVSALYSNIWMRLEGNSVIGPTYLELNKYYEKPIPDSSNNYKNWQ